MSDETDAVIDVRDAEATARGDWRPWPGADDDALDALALEMLTGGREAVVGVDVLASMMLVDPAAAGAVLGIEASHDG